MTLIVLTNTQSNQVRCWSNPKAALAPRPISVAATAQLAGKYVLPVAVLSDPNFQQFWAFLQPLQQVPDNTVILWTTNATDIANNTFKNSWPLGQVVTVPPSIG